MKNKNREQFKKIPGKFRKPIGKKKFKSIISGLTDKNERKLISGALQQNKSGRYVLNLPGNKKEADKIIKILKKTSKAKSGIRTVRLAVLIIIIVIPLLLNIFFLDKYVSSGLEKSLEKLTGTDVGIEDLDLQIIKGSFSAGNISFASVSDPMINVLEIRNLKSDINISSLFFRRFVVDYAGADLMLNTKRKSAAFYPDTASPAGSGSGEGKGKMPDFSWIPKEDIPDSSVKLAQKLTADTENYYRKQSENIYSEYKKAEALVKEIEDFINAPLPAETDINGWLEKINRAGELKKQIENSRKILNNLSSTANNALKEINRNKNELEKALKKDLEKIENFYKLDSSLVNRWIKSAVLYYAGPSLASIYKRAEQIAAELSDKIPSDNTSDESGKKGRMKSGRIVNFPVKLPPRFTVRKLYFSGSGMELKGEHLGIDQDLEGAPAHISFYSEKINTDLTIDTRTGAQNLIYGSVSASGINWENGILSTESSIKLTDADNFTLNGNAVIDQLDINLTENAGNVSVPDIVLSYNYTVNAGREELVLKPEASSLKAWEKYLTSVFADKAKARISGELEKNVQINIEQLNTAELNWRKISEKVHNTDNLLDSLEKQLEELIKNQPGKAGIPDAGGALDTLKKLF